MKPKPPVCSQSRWRVLTPTESIKQAEFLFNAVTFSKNTESHLRGPRALTIAAAVVRFGNAAGDGKTTWLTNETVLEKQERLTQLSQLERV